MVGGRDSRDRFTVDESEVRACKVELWGWVVHRSKADLPLRLSVA